MSTKTLGGSIKSADQTGTFTAVVSTYGPEPDLQGDVVALGAYQRTIAEWGASTRRLPILFGHRWHDDPFSHLGWVESMEEVEGLGLVVEGKLDLANPTAAYVHKLLKERRLAEFSIGYEIVRERALPGGATELQEIRLIEISVVLKGANQNTELIGAKAFPSSALEGSDLARELLAKGYDADVVAAIFKPRWCSPTSRDLESELLSKGYDAEIVALVFGNSPRDEEARVRERERSAARARFEAANAALVLGGPAS